MGKFKHCYGGDIEGVFFVSIICLSCPKFHSIAYRRMVFQGKTSFSTLFFCNVVKYLQILGMTRLLVC